jgi:hypothetical protein
MHGGEQLIERDLGRRRRPGAKRRRLADLVQLVLELLVARVRIRAEPSGVVALEARKEKGEGYSSIKGLFRQYELS